MTNLVFNLVAAAAAFLIGWALYPSFINLLKRSGSVQVIQEELSAEHQAKRGTPTGGGILFIGIGLAAGVFSLIGHRVALPATLGLVFGGLVGFADDRQKLIVGSLGIPARLKFPIQVVLAIPVAWAALSFAPAQHFLPSSPWVIWPLAVLAIAGTANAVNIADGIDGLCGGLCVIALVGIAALVPGASASEKLIASALIGGLLAFLVFNRHPAKVFMGDTGALGLGYAMAAMAIQQGWLIVLPVVGLVFVLETLSVIIQVTYFKVSGGKRVFRMAPIHHTFHLEGWSENRIALSFWSAGVLGAVAGAALAHSFS